MTAKAGDSHSPCNALDRRSFLRLGILAGSAAPFIARAQAESPAAPPAPVRRRKIRLGIVGCGGRGSWIARLFARHGGYEIHAVADYFQQAADACGDALGVDKGRRFSSLSGYKRVFESGVQAVALETPPCFFPEHAAAAVEAGLHVYMAKPIAVDVLGCRTVEAAATKAGTSKRVFLVDYQMPTDPENRRVAELIRNGAIGKVVALNSHYFATAFADPPKTASIESRLQRLIWVNDVAIGGSYHVNACIHAVEAALWLAGERPVAACGASALCRPSPHGDSHDVFQLVFTLANGLLLSHRGKHLDNLTGFDVLCTAQGQAGYGTVGYGGRAFLKGREESHSADVVNLYEAGAVRNIAAFYDAILAGDCSNPTVARATDSVLATILGREAGLARSWITMDDLLKKNAPCEVDLKGLRS
jgi:myo-inositol 2-dehydrogenase / D-chiro-inositol 1-dehydrogenase